MAIPSFVELICEERFFMNDGYGKGRLINHRQMEVVYTLSLTN